MKKTLIALVGSSGTGKDTIASKFIETYPYVHKIISCTTRPKRDYEINHQHYHFLTALDFTEKLKNNEMLEFDCFNNWFYGTEKSEIQNNYTIGIFTPSGIYNLVNVLPQSEYNLYLYYIQVDDKIRLNRLLNREKEPNIDEIIRRYNADKLDFQKFDSKFNFLPNCYKKTKIINNDSKDQLSNILTISGQIGLI